MSDILMYTCTPRQVKKFVEHCMKKRLVPYIQGSPGVGKSSIIAALAKEYNLHLIDHRLSTSAPEDMSGLPRFTEQGWAVMAPFTDIFPVEGMTPPEGTDGWILFLDEFNSAPKDVQAAAYKIILDRKVGQFKLHPQCVVVCAGNLMTDRAITNTLSTAMQSRLIHLEMAINFEEFMEDVAIPEQWDPRIVAFLNANPKKLMDFRPDHNDRTFCCPRTWSFMNDQIKGEVYGYKKKTINGFETEEYEMNEWLPMYAGTITSGVAADFVSFTKVFKDLVDIKTIMKDPANAPIPGDVNGRWAVVSSMQQHTNAESFEHLAVYANRLPLDMRILYYRFAMIGCGQEIRHTPTFSTAMLELAKYLS